MKKLYIRAFAALALATSLASCGDKFLETDIYGGIDSSIALDNPEHIGSALNGLYYLLYHYRFAGTEATAFGDLASDITYWNNETNHFSDIYQFSPTENSTLLKDVWYYGYKVAGGASGVIDASLKLYDKASEGDKAYLDKCLGEAYALRAYAHLVLVNMFSHQVKVAGADFSGEPGVVLVQHPIGAEDKVKRSTIGETYAAIETDLTKSLGHLEKYGRNPGLFYFNPAAVKGLQARVYLYEEKWQLAADAAKEALKIKGISSLITDPEHYANLYAGGASNTESFFALAITESQNWSAYSSGTLWSAYSYSPSPWLQSIMSAADCRRAVWGWDIESTETVPIFNSGKFLPASGNPAFGTCYLINAPEMFLIQAEALAQLDQPVPAATALIEVAKRNPAIASVADLPADKAGLLSFIKDERARELFQEGHRLYDLRRWGDKVNVQASKAPAVDWVIKGYDISNAVYPIPVAEINANMGVEQNAGWRATFPSM